MIITFTVPGRAPASTSPNSRANWRLKHADSRVYGETVLLIAQSANTVRNGSPWQRAHVTVTQKAMRLRDHDNFAASWKPGLDACVKAGLIEDDKPSCIDLTIRAERVRTAAEEAVIVQIEKL